MRIPAIRIQLCLNLHSPTRPHKNSRLDASSRAARWGRPSFCLALTGNRGLGRRRGVWRNKEGKRTLRAWEWAQRKTQLRLQMWKHPVHTNTYIQRRQGKAGGNEGHKVVILARCDWLVCNPGELHFFGKPAGCRLQHTNTRETNNVFTRT